MNLKSILTQMGLADGNGDVSSMRIMAYVVLAAILLPKIIFACQHGTEITFTNTDLEAMGIVLGAKLVQNVQESKATSPAPTNKGTP